MQLCNESAFTPTTSGAMAYKSGFYLAGDIHDKAYTRARQNATALEEETLKSRQLDVVQWDVMKIPLRTASVDVFVTDLVRS